MDGAGRTKARGGRLDHADHAATIRVVSRCSDARAARIRRSHGTSGHAMAHRCKRRRNPCADRGAHKHVIGTWRIGIWRRPEDFGSRYRGDPRRFSAYGLAGLWDAALGISLNGNDVSAIASQVAGGVDLPQATGANQPLYVGAPTYNGQPSIQFTAANADRLEASANIIAANPATFVLVMRDRTSATQGFFFGNSNSGA